MSVVTARHVAEHAGVSLSTVSRALSAPELVAERTRRRVQAAARELGYEPNVAARSLATGRTSSLGLVVPDLDNPFFSSVVKGVQAKAWAGGYTVVVADSNEDPAMERELLQSLAKQVDGLILCSPRTSDDAIAEVASRVRMALLNRTIPGILSVTIDNTQVVMTAVAHLRALGHRSIAYVGGPSTSWSDARRREGLRLCAERFSDITVTDLGHFRPHYSGGVAAADLTAASGATAVVTFNDLVAIGLMGRLKERGFVLPRQLSVVGIDDLSIAPLISPSLTSVRIPRPQLGSSAVQSLLDVLAGRRPTDGVSHETLPVDLVIRQSTAEPAEK